MVEDRPLLRFCALIVVGPLLSMVGQRALGFHQKYLISKMNEGLIIDNIL